MNSRIWALILSLVILLGLCGCSKPDSNSTFSIRFLDVGQGDAALVECDGHYMLIDGGGGKSDAENKNAGEKVYNALRDNGVKKLDILAISHLHADHIGGLSKGLQALEGRNPIGITISNSKTSDTATFRDFEHELYRNESEITIPAPGDVFKLGSATVKVLDTSAEEANDSMILLITYGSTRFLFTGDIERNGQLRVIEELQKDTEKYGQSLIKMPHHGAYNDDYGLRKNALYLLLREYDPNYIVVSVGKNNQYKHPHEETIDMLENLIIDVKGLNWSSHVFRTDENGDIWVQSNGKDISVRGSK